MPDCFITVLIRNRQADEKVEENMKKDAKAECVEKGQEHKVLKISTIVVV